MTLWTTIALFMLCTACAMPKRAIDTTVHELVTVRGSWRRQTNGTILMLTEESRDVAAGVKEICQKEICTSEPGGIVTIIERKEGESK